MRIARRYAVEGASPYSGIEFRTAKSEVRDLDGSAVFALDGIEVASSRRQGSTSSRNSCAASKLTVTGT